MKHFSVHFNDFSGGDGDTFSVIPMVLLLIYLGLHFNGFCVGDGGGGGGDRL